MNFKDYRNASIFLQIFSSMGITEFVNPPHVKFERLVTRHVERTIPNPKKAVYIKLKTESITISQKDIIVAQDGLLTIDGIKVCIYIRDQRQNINIYGGVSGYKYHLCDCSTIQGMRMSGREGRYLATKRADGLFEVYDISGYNPRKGVVKMELCKNCIDVLRSRGMYLTPFNLKNFYEKYDSMVPDTVKRIETVTEVQTYTPDFSDISREYKAAAKYRCSTCHVDCTSDQSLINLHHINGIKSDNKRENLVVLCLDCHSRQPNHSHMKSNPGYNKKIEQINKLRLAQNIGL